MCVVALAWKVAIWMSISKAGHAGHAGGEYPGVLDAQRSDGLSPGKAWIAAFDSQNFRPSCDGKGDAEMP